MNFVMKSPTTKKVLDPKASLVNATKNLKKHHFSTNIFRKQRKEYSSTCFPIDHPDTKMKQGHYIQGNNTPHKLK